MGVAGDRGHGQILTEGNLPRCVPANAITQAGELASRGPIIAPAIAAGKLRLVAGVYNIANGAVSIVR
ncbi:MAG TPA: hypothetical protein VGO24_06750 [Solirubrobacterales bacterium]|nr:hypothetical protein [Solirubrobacterales bacterium]